jgi:hypothetical protein
MAVTVQMQFESAVTEIYQKAFVGSSIENGTTVIQFDLRQLDFQRELGTTSPICWRQDVYHVDIHELSTFHNPIKYRFIVAQGYYLNDQKQRVYFTPDIQGVSTSQHMSKSIIRLCCYLAVVCGVSLRQIALIFSALFLRLLLDSRVLIGQFLRNSLFLQAFHEGRNHCSVFGKSLLISSAYVLFIVYKTPESNKSQS